jgi:hypothetical protein
MLYCCWCTEVTGAEAEARPPLLRAGAGTAAATCLAEVSGGSEAEAARATAAEAEVPAGEAAIGGAADVVMAAVSAATGTWSGAGCDPLGEDATEVVVRMEEVAGTAAGSDSEGAAAVGEATIAAAASEPAAAAENAAAGCDDAGAAEAAAGGRAPSATNEDREVVSTAMAGFISASPSSSSSAGPSNFAAARGCDCGSCFTRGDASEAAAAAAEAGEE